MSRKVEIWLRPNRRVLLAAAIAPLLLVVLGTVVAFDILVEAPLGARLLAGVLASFGVVLLAVLARYAGQPRLAYDGRHLLVYLRPSGPIAVSIEVVECFLLGSGVRELPGRPGREVQISQFIVRLAERATEWAQVDDVKPALGKWCGGYITIYGAWCEPLSIELVNRLNARLAAAHEDGRQKRAAFMMRFVESE
jgi:hypothetical protein